MQPSPCDVHQAVIVRRAAARAGCRVRSQDNHGHGVGSVTSHLTCADGWQAARLLLALAVEDSRGATARALAEKLGAGRLPAEAFARAIQTFVQSSVRFEPERTELFQSPAVTLARGYGDCDCQFRLVYAIARAGGLPAALALAHYGDGTGPTHAVAKVAGKWLETTVPAFYDEEPFTAARRLGILSVRRDIAKEVCVMTEENSLPPLPPAFRERNDPAQVLLDSEALQRLGYLDASASNLSDPADPVLRQAVLAFQLATSLVPDGLLGPATRTTLARELTKAGTEGFGYPGIGTIGGSPEIIHSGHLSDDFFRDVDAMALRFQAGGATATAEDFLRVWLAESGIQNIPNSSGQPYYGLNQMGLAEQRGAGFRGTAEDWLRLSLRDQLPYVERFYINATKGRFGTLRDVSSLYLANIAHAYMDHAGEPNFPIYKRNPAGPMADAPAAEWAEWTKVGGGHRSDAYAFNRGMDHGKKGYIAVSDLQHFVDGAIASPKRLAYWNEVAARLAHVRWNPPDSVGAVATTLVLLLAMGAGAAAVAAAT